MSDRFDEMAADWFAKLPHLTSEISARRSLAKFLREAVEAELQRAVPKLVGEYCARTKIGKPCREPAVRLYWQRAFASAGVCMTPMCSACAALVEPSSDGVWLTMTGVPVSSEVAPSVRADDEA